MQVPIISELQFIRLWDKQHSESQHSQRSTARNLNGVLLYQDFLQTIVISLTLMPSLGMNLPFEPNVIVEYMPVAFCDRSSPLFSELPSKLISILSGNLAL